MTSTASPFGITVCGIEELAGHCDAGASHVLSILDPDYPVPEAFGSYGEHAKLELRFYDVIEETPGKPGPQAEHVERLLGFGRDLLADPAERRHLLVHCHAGISRSTASMALILALALPDEAAPDILRRVVAIRDKAWPNLRLIELGDALLQRGGSLIEATHALHRRQLDRRPHIAEFMEAESRSREIIAARGHAALLIEADASGNSDPLD